MSSNSKLFNAAVRHQIYLQRFAGTNTKAFKKTLVRIKNKALKALTGPNIQRDRRHILNTIDALINQEFQSTNEEVINNLSDLASYETGFTKRLVEQSTKVELSGVGAKVISNQVLSKAYKFSPTEQMDIEQALQVFGDTKRKQILNTIKDGITNNEAIPVISKNIREITSLRTLQQADTLSRTLVQQVTTASRDAVYKANKAIIAAVEWVSVLDGDTTDGCKALDGQVFPVGEGIRPGYHWNCRSVMVPVVHDEFNLAAGAGVSRAARGESGKTESIGNTTYQSWLKQQPASFQDNVLGPTKGQLFRKGGITLDKFVDSNYKELSLEQLRKTDDKDIQEAFNLITN